MVVPFWTPITPLTGSLLHADPHVGPTRTASSANLALKFAL